MSDKTHTTPHPHPRTPKPLGESELEQVVGGIGTHEIGHVTLKKTPNAKSGPND